MSDDTIFLLTLIGVLIPANLFLWWVEKRSIQKSQTQTIQKHPKENIEPLQEASQKTFPEIIETEQSMEKLKDTKTRKWGKSKRLIALESYLKKMAD